MSEIVEARAKQIVDRAGRELSARQAFHKERQNSIQCMIDAAEARNHALIEAFEKAAVPLVKWLVDLSKKPGANFSVKAKRIGDHYAISILNKEENRWITETRFPAAQERVITYANGKGPDGIESASIDNQKINRPFCDPDPSRVKLESIYAVVVERLHQEGYYNPLASAPSQDPSRFTSGFSSGIKGQPHNYE